MYPYGATCLRGDPASSFAYNYARNDEVAIEKLNGKQETTMEETMQNNKTNENKSQHGLKYKTNIKAGIIVVCRTAGDNHNQTLLREAKNLRVKSNIKAGLKISFDKVATKKI